MGAASVRHERADMGGALPEEGGGLMNDDVDERVSVACFVRVENTVQETLH